MTSDGLCVYDTSLGPGLTLYRMWGLAAFYGSRAYNDAELQQIAVDVWNVAEDYSVSVQDAEKGTQHTRNTSFSARCQSGCEYQVFFKADVNMT